LALTDIGKAYDDKNRQEILKVLHRTHVSKGIIKTKNIYGECENMVINGKKSEHFQMFRRYRQGSDLSPMLFNMVMDEIIRTVT
jgi:hypothetical protein